MGLTLYDTLGVSRNAPGELIEAAYHVATKRLRERLDRGDASARWELRLIEDAFNTLSDSAKRASYDLQLASPAPALVADKPPIYLASYSGRTSGSSGSLSWLGKVAGWLVLGGLALGFLAVGHRYYATAVQGKVTAEGGVANEAIRADTEGRLVDGLIRNQGKSIDSRSQIANRSLGQQEVSEERSARLREAQLEMQRQQMARSAAIQQMNVEAQRQREEAQRIDRERRYYACLNPAIDLHGAARAQMMCAHYR